MAACDVSRIQISVQTSGFEQVPDSRGPVNLLRTSAMVGSRQIVIIAYEVPPQAVIERKVRSDVERILCIQSPSLLEFIQVIGRSMLPSQILLGFLVIRETAAHRADATNPA